MCVEFVSVRHRRGTRLTLSPAQAVALPLRDLLLSPALERRRPRRKANPKAAQAAKKALDEMVARVEARAGAKVNKPSRREVKRGHSGRFAPGTAPGPGRPKGTTGIRQVPRHIHVLVRYLVEGGLMTEDDKGDPIAVSHLLFKTMVNGLKGNLVTHVGEKGTTYEARLGWATLLFKVTEETT